MKQTEAKLSKAVAVLAAALAFSAPALAEPPRPADETDVVTFSLENDLVSNQDDNYTNGIRLAYLSPESNLPGWIDRAADALPLFAEGGHRRWSFELGQSMYSPGDITLNTPQPDDRPYAGWLYTGFGLVSDTGARLDNLQLKLGMVGPASGAAEAQALIHRLIKSPRPRGWRDQLKNEPGVVLSYERKWRGIYRFKSIVGLEADITPAIGGSIGNVFTNASAGAVIRIGGDLPSDYGPPLIQPSLPGSDFFVPSRTFGWYFFGGFEGRAVARDIFLDGNSFQDSPRVSKKPFVGGLSAGVAITFQTVRVAYTHVLRTEEFSEQKRPDDYGALTLSLRF